MPLRVRRALVLGVSAHVRPLAGHWLLRSQLFVVVLGFLRDGRDTGASSGEALGEGHALAGKLIVELGSPARAVRTRRTHIHSRERLWCGLARPRTRGAARCGHVVGVVVVVVVREEREARQLIDC